MAFKKIVLLWVCCSSLAHAETSLQALIGITSAQAWSSFEANSRGETLLNRRCKEELVLGLVPVACYLSTPMSSEIEVFLDRRCQQNAVQLRSLEILTDLLTHDEVSRFCKRVLKEQATILAYKLEDSSPQKAFEFLKMSLGPKIETRLTHVQPTSTQSN